MFAVTFPAWNCTTPAFAVTFPAWIHTIPVFAVTLPASNYTTPQFAIALPQEIYTTPQSVDTLLSASGLFCGGLNRLTFLVRQNPPLPRRQIAEPEIANPHA